MHNPACFFTPLPGGKSLFQLRPEWFPTELRWVGVKFMLNMPGFRGELPTASHSFASALIRASLCDVAIAEQAKAIAMQKANFDNNALFMKGYMMGCKCTHVLEADSDESRLQAALQLHAAMGEKNDV